MNRIFFWLILVAVLCAAGRELLVSVPFEADPNATGALATVLQKLDYARSQVDLNKTTDGIPISPMEDLSGAIFASAKKAVLDVALPLIGGMTFFLGLMKVVENAGGLKIVAKLIRPLMVRLFPDVPSDHPAMGAMIMNLSANALGLGNAATPFGIRAIQELDKLNPHKGTATNAMALFLVMNTSGVTLLATGVVVMRQSFGSQDPAGIIGTTLFATACSTILGTLACKLLERFSPLPTATNPVDASETENNESYPLWATVLAFSGIAAFIPLTILFGKIASPWLIPLLVLGFLAFGYFRGVLVYESFVEGARDGFATGTRIIPFLVGILVLVGMLNSSGAMDGFAALIGPLTTPVGLPAEALPMALIRPLSGSGATGVLTAILSNPTIGPDSYVGYLVSTIAGSTETTFYVLAVYFGSVGVNNVRHTLPAALFADVCGLIGSIVAVQLYFRFVL